MQQWWLDRHSRSKFRSGGLELHLRTTTTAAWTANYAIQKEQLGIPPSQNRKGVLEFALRNPEVVFGLSGGANIAMQKGQLGMPPSQNRKGVWNSLFAIQQWCVEVVGGFEKHRQQQRLLGMPTSLYITHSLERHLRKTEGVCWKSLFAIQRWRLDYCAVWHFAVAVRNRAFAIQQRRLGMPTPQYRKDFVDCQVLKTERVLWNRLFAIHQWCVEVVVWNSTVAMQQLRFGIPTSLYKED
jgi:hypothetical protein